MIRWCAYCQQFQGEVQPYDDYGFTHGICESCGLKDFKYTDQEFIKIQTLVKIQKQLFDAGLEGGETLAEEAIEEAKQAGVQSVDLLMGLIAPLLWKVGKLWETGDITVADEHRFTKVYESIVAKIENIEPADEFVDVLLINAPANTHYLGLRVLNLWLQSKQIKSAIFKINQKELVIAEIVKLKPKFLGFSVATEYQLLDTVTLAEKVQLSMGSEAPKLIIGGAAVKRGAYQNTAAITYLSDINQFLYLLKADQQHQ